MDDRHHTFHRSSLTVLVFHVFLTHVCKGQSELIGSSQPIVATLGEDVVLPCHLQPATDATDLTVEWARPDLSPRFVHVRRSHEELVDKKHASFQGRTSLFIDELKKGNISLKLSKVKLSDEGRYRCFMPVLGKQTFVQLRFPSVPVCSPVISLLDMDRDRGGVVLQCESAGWYPEPEVLWLDAEGNLLSAGPPETVRGPDDLYTVSSRVTVDKRHSNSFTCRVQQTNINQTREAHIHVPDDFFLSSSSSAVPINTGLAVSLAVSIMVILAGVFFVWRQNTTKTKKRSRDEAEKETEKMKLLEETKDLTEKYEKIEEELQKTKEELKNKTEEMRLQLKNKTEEMEKHVNELKEEKKKLEEELETRNKELEKIKDEVGRLTGDKTNLQQEIQRKEKILETRNKELKEIKDESSSSNKRMEDKLRRYKAAASISIWFLRFSSSKKKEEINQLKEEKKILEEELEKIINKLRRYKTAASISIWFLRLSRSKKVEEEVEKLTGDKMKLQEEKQQLKEIKDENSSSSDSQETSRDITVGVNQEYGCIFLRNMSDQDKPLGGRQLKVQINNEEPITYTFDQSVEVKAGKSVTLYRPDYAEHFGATADQVWSDLKSWMHGDRVQVTLQ